MKKFTIILCAAIFIMSGFLTARIKAESEKYYFALFNGKAVIAEDYEKFKGLETGFNTSPEDYGKGYDELGGDFTALVKKYSEYKEDVHEYYFNEYHDEFSRYSALTPGDILFVSSDKGVFAGEVSGYYINLDDMIGGGCVFYAVLEMKQNIEFKEYEIMLCSGENNISRLDRTGGTDEKLRDKFKDYLMPLLKNVMITDYSSEKPDSVKLKTLKADELIVFKGNFTGTNGAGSGEYLVNVLVRNDFTAFTSLLYVMDENGKVIKELSPLAINEFYFAALYAVVDLNGNGIQEIITNDGYYEGEAYNLFKFENGEFILITSGFLFGV